MSSISDALKRAQQERERLRSGAPDGSAGVPTEQPEASLASVVLRKSQPVSAGDSLPAVASTSPAAPVTPLADAIRNAPQTPPPAVRAQQAAAETIIEDYASKRKLNLPRSMVVYHERAGAAAEQYRKIRDVLMAGNVKREHQILVVTSAAPERARR